ncbi:hypothetical protein EV421DRAFT_1714366, partial [Armillaria borealis]
EDFTPRTKEIQGHRHLLTFVDGPRTYLGKTFALAEFKVSKSLSGKVFILLRIWFFRQRSLSLYRTLLSSYLVERSPLFTSTMGVFGLDRKLLVKTALGFR